MKRLQNFFARCSLFELNEACQESKLDRVFFRNILRIIISKVFYFLDKRQKVYGKISTSGVAENKYTFLNLKSQMKQEFICLCGCYHQDSDFVPQNRSNSQKYKETRHKCKVTHFAGRTAKPNFMLIICFHLLNVLCRFLDKLFFAGLHLYSVAFVVRLKAFSINLLFNVFQR